MRVVEHLTDLHDQVRAARREAHSAFGDPTVFCERYLPRGRHIEVQVMADRYGTGVGRRGAGVLDPATPPEDHRRGALTFGAAHTGHAGATVRGLPTGRGAIGYTGAGTVEFLADENGDFFFLEMNTRLGRTPGHRLTSRLDLVELQISVADGDPLPAGPPAATGHSIEARLYAEDPARAGSRRPDGLTTSRYPVRQRNSGSPIGPGFAWTPESWTVRWCRSTMTRCWPR